MLALHSVNSLEQFRGLNCSSECELHTEDYKSAVHIKLCSGAFFVEFKIYFILNWVLLQGSGQKFWERWPYYSIRGSTISSVATPLQQVLSNSSIFHWGKHPVKTDMMYDNDSLHPYLVPLTPSSSLMPFASSLLLSLSVVWQSICLQHPPHVWQRRQANRLHPLQLHEGDFIKPTQPRRPSWWVDGCWKKWLAWKQ